MRRLLSRYLLFAACVWKTSYAALNVYVQAGFKSQMNDNLNFKITKISGTRPSWLRGSLLKQRCGTLGFVQGKSGFVMQHVFDCISMCSTYKIKPIGLSYTNSYYNTKSFSIWKENDKDMSKSQIAWYTKYSSMSAGQFRKYQNLYTDRAQYEPSTTFWRLDYNYYAAGDDFAVYRLNPNRCTLTKVAKFPENKKKPNLGLGDDWFFVNNAAMAAWTWNNRLWSATGAYKIEANLQGQTVVKLYRMNGVTKFRKPIKNHWTIGSFDLTKCRGGGQYPDSSELLGHMSYVMQTPKFIIIPVGSYVLDVCNAFVYSRTVDARPTYSNNYYWRSDKLGQILLFHRVTRKTKIVQLPTTLFSPQGVNAYQRDRKRELYVDILTYPDANVWTQSYLLNNLFNEVNQKDATITRYIIDLKTYSVKNADIIMTPRPVGFPKINMARDGTKYRFVYLVYKPYQSGNGICKYDVKQKTCTMWYAADRLFAEEPAVIKYPVPFVEDDCVLLIAGVDSTDDTLPIGTMWVVNCKSMQEKTRWKINTATPFGFHARWFNSVQLPPDHTDSQLGADLAVGLVVGAVVVTPVIIAIVLATQ